MNIRVSYSEEINNSYIPQDQNSPDIFVPSVELNVNPHKSDFSRCAICKDLVKKTGLMSHLEKHAAESLDEEQKAFDKTQAIRKMIRELEEK